MANANKLLNHLAKYDTATICNVIELFDVRPHATGFMDGRIKAAYPEMAPMVGYATTATFRSAAISRGVDIYGALEAQLKEMASLPGPSVVVFQDLDDPPVGATFGEIMCSVYQAFGSVGLITSGGGRDLAPVRKLGFPVFIGSTICSHAYSHLVDVGRAVRVGGLVVHPGDLLHGDADGVTSIPIEIAAEVVDAADDYIAAERILLDYAQGKEDKSIAGLMDRRKATGEAMAALRRRVSRAKS
jgi:4-hydroxy-4-methyl-2-oxoglutarate aldolase